VPIGGGAGSDQATTKLATQISTNTKAAYKLHLYTSLRLFMAYLLRRGFSTALTMMQEKDINWVIEAYKNRNVALDAMKIALNSEKSRLKTEKKNLK
jgi:hypothetical protein